MALYYLDYTKLKLDEANVELDIKKRDLDEEVAEFVQLVS